MSVRQCKLQGYDFSKHFPACVIRILFELGGKLLYFYLIRWEKTANINMNYLNRIKLKATISILRK